VAAILLTAAFLPALYVARFRITPEHLDEGVVPAETAALAPA
jgi:hypothetical protein